MMLNPNEELIDFATARARSGMPTKVGIGCWYRWALKGINGVRLEHVRIGRRLFTSTESVARFLAATNALPSDIVSSYSSFATSSVESGDPEFSQTRMLRQLPVRAAKRGAGSGRGGNRQHD